VTGDQKPVDDEETPSWRDEVWTCHYCCREWTPGVPSVYPPRCPSCGAANRGIAPPARGWALRRIAELERVAEEMASLWQTFLSIVDDMEDGPRFAFMLDDVSVALAAYEQVKGGKESPVTTDQEAQDGNAHSPE